MSFIVRSARTSGELDAVFRLRHQVFVEEEHYMPPRPDGRIADRFDAYPTTTNIVAMVAGQIVGSIRFMERSAAGLSTDEFFDFTGHVVPRRTDGSSGMLVVARRHRLTPRLVSVMVSVGYLWATARGLTRLLGTINPERLAAFQRTGYRQVAPEFRHALRDLDVIPMILDVGDLNSDITDFISAHRRHAPCPGERHFYVAGAHLATRHEHPHTRYRIVRGRAAIKSPARGWDELGPGAIIEPSQASHVDQSAQVVAVDDLDLVAER